MGKRYEVLGPSEYRRCCLKTRIEKIDVAVVELKHDGTLVFKNGNVFSTKNAPLLPQWEQVVRSRFPEIVRSGRNIIFELGGERNAPAGYTRCWKNMEWDYRVLDYYDSFRYPLDELRDEGLKVVEVIREFSDFYSALEFALREVHNWKDCEGLVVKAYGLQNFPDKALFVKVKHDNVGKWFQILSGSEKEEFEKAPYEEIRKEVQKIVVEELARGRRVEQIDLNSIWSRLEAELAKHGYKLDFQSDRQRVRQALMEVKKELRRQIS